jgi:hypothetical protein
MIGILGVDGMSSDETDQEASRGVIKSVRRVRKAWLSEEVVQVWHTIEAYHQERSKAKSKCGKKAYMCNLIPADDHRSYNRIKTGLPKNYYDPFWWQSLIDSDKLMIRMQPPQPLPNLSAYVFPPPFCMTC